MKKLISKVLLALIILSVVAPVCAGVPSIALQGINVCKKRIFFGLSGLGGAVVGGLVGFGLRVAYVLHTDNPSTLANHEKDETTIAADPAEYDKQVKAFARLNRIATFSGAFLGACAGLYFASRRYSKV